ncbi:MAG: YbhB/YbcL family Raf kinase inhibitor-like protein [Planctomycetota bacterium]
MSLGCEEISLNQGEDENGSADAESDGTAGDKSMLVEPDISRIPADISLTSTAFNQGGAIPALYTGAGEDISPPLQWSNVPDDAQALVLVVQDIDSPSPDPWVHWLLYGIPADTNELPAGIARGNATITEPIEAMQGRNSFSFNDIGWRGPAPPEGDSAHRYVFRLFALDANPELEGGLKYDDLMAEIEDNIIAMGELIGAYTSPGQ